MRISFFEEFPTPENLQRVVPFSFPTVVYVAAPSLKTFKEVRDRLRSLNPQVDAAYWPILSKSYWVSPFCTRQELDRLTDEVCGLQDAQRVLIDFEIPVLAKGQIVRNMIRFRSNKRIIESMFASIGERLVTAEYPPFGTRSQRILEALGLSASLKSFQHTRMLMFYTTFIKSRLARETIKRFILRLHKEYGGSIHVGLGTIARGIFGNENILPADELALQLRFFRDEGIPEVTLYRLGGLTDRYLDAVMEIACL